MASQSLYRKWRSQTFSDLVGQEPIVRTLCHAVRDGRLAHAYLFCGPRGTGKTSVARLLAKAVNCANPRDGEPCNECLSCRQITEGRSPDVFEIDAASNNGVDNIRELRENVNFLSTGGRYKVYIVDEVHMLSTQAFNALLKTLEEPPPHVIFVLATTEAHKVLPTIVSRCQRFDFRRFSRKVIVARLNHVAAGEDLALEPAAADLLARAAQGGMRDALSLLDQAMAFCGREITLEGVRGMLGLADIGAVRALVEHVAAGRPAAGLHLINELVEAGADLRQLNSQIAELWRALVLARAGANVAEVMDSGPEEAADYATLASYFTLEELAACARVFAANETPARGLPVPQLGLELSFLECLGIRQRGGAAPTASATAPGARPAPAHDPRPAPPAPSTPNASAAPAIAAMPRPEASARPTAPVPAAPAVAASDPAAEDEVEEIDLAALDVEPVEAVDATPMDALPAAPEPLSVAQGAPSREDASDTPGEDADEASVVANDDWLPFIQSQWELVKKVCKQKKRTVAALLHSARPIMVAPGETLEIVLQADYQFHLDKLRDPGCRADVEWALEQVLERPCHVRLVLAGQDGPGATPGGPGAGGPAGSDGGPGSGPANPGPNGLDGAGGDTNGANGHSANGHHDTRAPTASASANGASHPRATLAHLTPLPRPADVAADMAADVAPLGPNGRIAQHGQNRHGSTGGNGHAPAPGNGALRDTTAGYISLPDVANTSGLTPSDDLRALEAEALADPLVRELMTSLPAKLVEVRRLGPEDAS